MRHVTWAWHPWFEAWICLMDVLRVKTTVTHSAGDYKCSSPAPLWYVCMLSLTNGSFKSVSHGAAANNKTEPALKWWLWMSTRSAQEVAVDLRLEPLQPAVEQLTLDSQMQIEGEKIGCSFCNMSSTKPCRWISFITVGKVMYCVLLCCWNL